MSDDLVLITCDCPSNEERERTGEYLCPQGAGDGMNCHIWVKRTASRVLPNSTTHDWRICPCRSCRSYRDLRGNYKDGE